MEISTAEIVALVTAITALGGMLIQWRRARGEGLSAIAAGYDRLAPHLTKRIDELEKEIKAEKKSRIESEGRISSLEERAAKRSQGIDAAVEYMKTSRDAIDHAINLLERLS